ncbi:hypothetical protein ACOSP7_020433 [Xanthoceras sorbifolium]
MPLLINRQHEEARSTPNKFQGGGNTFLQGGGHQIFGRRRASSHQIFGISKIWDEAAFGRRRNLLAGR